MLSLQKILFIGVSTALICSFGKSAEASTFFSTSSGQVGSVDASTGNFTPLVTNGPAFTDIALTDNGELFGITFTDLYQINQNTNSSSFVGNLGSFGMNALGFTDTNQLYGARFNGGFYEIDVTTGAASLIAGTSSFRSSGDMVFDTVNQQFWATSSSNKLFTIGLDGTLNEIGDLGFQNVYGLFFDNGTLYGHTAVGQQITIDTTTGQGTFDKNITGHQGNIWGSASLPSSGPGQSVPEPTSVLGLLGFATFGAKSILKRRKRNFENSN